jgi:peroxiredoxin
MTTTASTSAAPAAGDLAPDFTLDSTAGTKVTLSSFRGQQHVLLAFFPLAFTSVCTAELCDFTSDFEQFATAEVVVLPISVDSVPTLKEFKAKLALSLELLSDFKRQVSRAYGVLLEEQFFSARAYFLIDRGGHIRWKHIEATPGQRRQNTELLEQIRKLGA